MAVSSRARGALGRRGCLRLPAGGAGHGVGKPRRSGPGGQLREGLNGNRVQLTADGVTPYVWAVEPAFGADAHYAQEIKVFEADGMARDRYRPPDFVTVTPIVIAGHPDDRRISTSFVERQNLTMRMQMRRLTRLTNGFSKKLGNLKAALALHFAWYNLVRTHRSLRVTPAMAGGITPHLWEVADLLKWEAPYHGLPPNWSS